MLKNIFSFAVIAAFAAMFVSCANEAWEEELGLAPQAQAVPVDYEPLDSSSVIVNYDDGTQDWGVQHRWTLTAEDTIKAQGTEGFKASDQLSKKAQNEIMFMYNYGKVNTLKVSGIAMTYKGKTIYPKNMNNMIVKGSREVVETAVKPFFEMSATNYTLVYGSLVLASARQMFVVDEGYVPSFERIFWSHFHNAGTAKAAYNNNVVTITCLDSLKLAELWDDGSLREATRKAYHSQNSFSVAVSGTEVNKLSDVVGKSFSGSSAKFDVFEIKVAKTGSKIQESSLMYRNVNFVDSLEACQYVVKGGKVLSATKVRVDFVRSGNPADEVSVEIPVNLTEKEKPVYLVRVDSSFVHNNYVATVEPNGNTLPIISNHTATFEKVMSNGTRADKKPVNYTWVNNYSISYNPNMTVDDLNSVLGRHTVNSNGSVTVAGYSFTVSFVNRACSDIMYNGKNYKAYAPVCEAKVVAITINKNNLVVEFQGDHDGDNSVIKATLPLTVTEKEKPADVDVEILRVSITDAYTNQHAAQEGTYLHILGKKNGSYVVLSQKVGATTFKQNNISNADGNAIVSSGRAIAYVYNGSSYQIGTVTSEDGVANKGYYLRYYVADGRLAYSLGSGTGTEALKDGFRDAIRGTVSKANADGSWTVSADGKTYTFRGL